MFTGYQARIDKHSVSPWGSELLTAVVTYPREVLAEVRTHRTLSQETQLEFSEKSMTERLSMNSASSRAIPTSVLLEQVRDNPYIPWHLGKNQRGMQADQQLPEAERELVEEYWRKAARRNADTADLLSEKGAHKQVVNRLLEPFTWVTQVVSGTTVAWNNFFALRCHSAAHPAFRRIARMIYLLKTRSMPKPLQVGQWHLPFVSNVEVDRFYWWSSNGIDPGPMGFPAYCDKIEEIPDIILHSVACCARVSLLKHDGTTAAPEDDKALCLRLAGESPVHASPWEHQATPVNPSNHSRRPTYLASNFDSNWVQLRKLIPHETCHLFAPPMAQLDEWFEEDPWLQEWDNKQLGTV